MTIGIIGTGRMARAMATALLAAEPPTVDGEHTAPVLLARPRWSTPGYLPPPVPGVLGHSIPVVDLTEMLRRATTVVLALPFPGALDLLAAGLGEAGVGRVLIDVTNPRVGIGAQTWSHTALSGGEQIAELAATWTVAKAFNTVAAEAFAACRLAGAPVTVPVATDHATARAVVFAMARRLGFEPVDAGGIHASRDLESLAALLVGVGAAHGLGSQVAIHIGQPDPVSGVALPAPRTAALTGVGEVLVSPEGGVAISEP